VVNLILISHSKPLAAATRELALQMTAGEVRIALAAGFDDANHPYGTDPLHITRAIHEVYTPDGVVVLADLGSAVMNAEIALESLPERMRKRVLLSLAPFVEGAVAAAAQAGAGASLAEVLREAENVGEGKAATVGVDRYVSLPDDLAIPDSDKREISITVPNELGLHARPAARLVGLLHGYRSYVLVRERGGLSVNAKSISKVMTLDVKKGDILIFEIYGEDGAEVEKTLAQFTAANFGDAEENQLPGRPVVASPTDPAEARDGVIIGIPAAPGIYVGPAAVASGALPDLSTLHPAEPAAEWSALTTAIDSVVKKYEAARDKLGSKHKEKEIFAFPLLLLRDQDLLEKVKHLIVTTGQTAARMWQLEMVHLEKEYLKGERSYLRERAGDIREISRGVIQALVGKSAHALVMEAPGVLVLDDIGPGEMAELNTDLVRGILTARGGRTSHASILARSLAIPCIVGVG